MLLCIIFEINTVSLTIFSLSVSSVCSHDNHLDCKLKGFNTHQYVSFTYFSTLFHHRSVLLDFT